MARIRTHNRRRRRIERTIVLGQAVMRIVRMVAYKHGPFRNTPEDRARMGALVHRYMRLRDMIQHTGPAGRIKRLTLTVDTSFTPPPAIDHVTLTVPLRPAPAEEGAP